MHLHNIRILTNEVDRFSQSDIYMLQYLPPANEFCEGYVFTGVCLSTRGGMRSFTWGGMHGFIWRGICSFILGGHVWFYSGGACVVLLGGHAWFYLGGVCGFIWGVVCMVLFGGHAWFYSGGCAWYFQGGMVFSGGHAWFFWGGMHGFSGGGGMRGFFSFFRYNEIRSMSGRYASYWNAFLYFGIFVESVSNTQGTIFTVLPGSEK